MREDTILEVTGLRKYYPIARGLWRSVVGQVKAVDNVSFEIPRGGTLGLVGESGCGKTTTGRCILRAIEPTSGQILFRRGEEVIDVTNLNFRGLKGIRRDMQLIFQDPYSSLNPRMTVKDIIGEPLLVNQVSKGQELEDRVAELMRQVGLRPEYMRRYPHAFSGGQRQRIGIARALALNPRLIICDESVSALDVSIQAQILNLLRDLQRERHLTYLFIAHDLSVVEHISDRVAVMYVGKVVEIADKKELFAYPRHPYTEALLSAAPKMDPRLKAARIPLKGEVGDSINPPPGCYFHPRCNYAKKLCSVEMPELQSLYGNGHLVACHFAKELRLRGAVVAS